MGGFGLLLILGISNQAVALGPLSFCSDSLSRANRILELGPNLSFHAKDATQSTIDIQMMPDFLKTPDSTIVGKVNVFKDDTLIEYSLINPTLSYGLLKGHYVDFEVLEISNFDGVVHQNRKLRVFLEKAPGELPRLLINAIQLPSGKLLKFRNMDAVFFKDPPILEFFMPSEFSGPSDMSIPRFFFFHGIEFSPSKQGHWMADFSKIKTLSQLKFALAGLRELGLREGHEIFNLLMEPNIRARAP